MILRLLRCYGIGLMGVGVRFFLYSKPTDRVQFSRQYLYSSFTLGSYKEGV